MILVRVMLCKFYFETDEYRKDNDKLTWFGEREGTFKVAIGGDGAPFGKWDQAMSWLIRFFKCGTQGKEKKQKTSPMIIFSCSEPTVKRTIRLLLDLQRD